MVSLTSLVLKTLTSKLPLPLQQFNLISSPRCLPVPKPIGGTLVLAANSLFYLNQGIPPYGVTLNSIGDNTVEGANVQKNLGRNSIENLPLI